MKFACPAFLILILISVSCRPAAAPVAVGNKPVSVNDVPLKDAQARPTKPIHEMSWTGFDGNIQKLKDHRGKAVILDFWATYCKPCIDMIPHLKSLQAQYGSDLVVVGLHVGGEEDRPKVPEFVDRLKIDYTLAYPEEALTAFVFGQDTAIPQTAIFDREGRMVRRLTGFSEAIRVQVDEAVEKAVNGGA
jgi:thiol-disulfide isomerase/thioredoxin